MRDAFIDELLAKARRDPDIFLAVGDLGYGVVDEFARHLPHQFLNAGVAEQNMVSTAAGLASTGYKVFVYSIANFPTLRALEQIRNDVCYHGCNVTIVSVGAGLAYGTLGYTHHAVEDISILRALPGLRIISPADAWEARAAVHESLRHHGPTYVRLGKSGESDLHSQLPSMLSMPFRLREGRDLTIVGVGAIVNECLSAADILKANRIEATVISAPTLKPLDIGPLLEGAPGVPLVTVEEHVLDGGFGTAVLEAINLEGVSAPLKRLGLRNDRLSDIGSVDYLRRLHGLDASGIAESAVDWLRNCSGVEHAP